MSQKSQHMHFEDKILLARTSHKLCNLVSFTNLSSATLLYIDMYLYQISFRRQRNIITIQRNPSVKSDTNPSVTSIQDAVWGEDGSTPS